MPFNVSPVVTIIVPHSGRLLVPVIHEFRDLPVTVLSVFGELLGTLSSLPFKPVFVFSLVHVHPSFKSSILHLNSPEAIFVISFHIVVPLFADWHAIAGADHESIHPRGRA